MGMACIKTFIGFNRVIIFHLQGIRKRCNWLALVVPLTDNETIAAEGGGGAYQRAGSVLSRMQRFDRLGDEPLERALAHHSSDIPSEATGGLCT